MKLIATLLALLFLPVLLPAPSVSAQAPSLGACPVFPAGHVWNTPIDTLPLDPSSTTYVNTIGANVGLKADFGAGLWDGGPIGIPFVTVPGTQTKYPASFYYDEDSDPGPYAIPLNVPIEGGAQSSGMSGVPDERWNNSDLNKLKTVLGSNLQAVDESALMIDPNSGRARQPGGAAVGVSVTPATASVVAGASRQLTATVSGTTNQAVTWLVNGVAGGNGTLGVVSTTGLYSAPASVPVPATVQVQARSVADPTATGSASITITAPAPQV